MIKRVKDFIIDDIGVVPYLFATVFAAKTIGYSLWPVDMVSYIALMMCSVILLSKRAKFDTLLLAFIIYLPLSIFIDRPDPMFNPWSRYLLLLFLLVCVSPLVLSEYSIKFRQGVLNMTLIYCVIISVSSFFCYFAGINLMRNNLSSIEMGYLINKAGTFSGITSHSMLLGPISGVASLVATYKSITSKKRKIWVFISLACCGALLFSASRSSLIAAIAGELCLLRFHTRQRRKTLKYLVTILAVGAVTFPFWQNALDGITAKNMGNISQGINTNSRDNKWECRMAEFRDSPITGIGFASVSSRDSHGLAGKIEPGSSWLAILSMTGIIGFSLFAVIFCRAVKRTLMTLTPEGALLGGILVLLGVHMIAEGHIFSAGSFLCFCVWLSLGCCTDYASYVCKSEKVII